MAPFGNRYVLLVVCFVTSLVSLSNAAPSVSVEQPSATACQKYMIRCDDGQCIDTNYWCDGDDNCDDKSDEKYCKTISFWTRDPNNCADIGYFKCQNNICIPIENRCDGHNHCKDGSDEDKCIKESSEEDDSSEENERNVIEQENIDKPENNESPETDPEDTAEKNYSNTSLVVPNEEDPNSQTHTPCPHTSVPIQYDLTTCPHIQALCSQLQMICSGRLNPWPCPNPCVQNSIPCPNVQQLGVQNNNPCPHVQTPCAPNSNPCPHVQTPCVPNSNPCPHVQPPCNPNSNPPNFTPCPHVPKPPNAAPCPQAENTTPCPHVHNPPTPTLCPHLPKPGKPSTAPCPTPTLPCPYTSSTTQSTTTQTTRSTQRPRRPRPSTLNPMKSIPFTTTPKPSPLTKTTENPNPSPTRCPFAPPTPQCPQQPSTQCPNGPCCPNSNCPNPCHNPPSCPNTGNPPCDPERDPCNPECNPCGPVTEPPTEPPSTPPCVTPPGPCSHIRERSFNFPEREYEDYQFIYDDQMEKAKKWLLNTRNTNYDWGAATPRGLVALSLLDQGLFSDFDSVDNGLMKRAFQVKLANEKELKSPFSKERLAQYLNAMLATNQNPRDFRGTDLLQVLRVNVDYALEENRPINPFVALSICLAGASEEEGKFPYHAVEWLNPPSYEHKYQDMMSFAIMTLACYANDPAVSVNYQKDIDGAVERLLKRMNSDGSFGSKYSTALAAQALLSVKTHGNWDSRKTLDFLANHQVEDGSFGNLMATYYIVPALAGKSLLHLINTVCEVNEPTETDTPMPEITTTPKPITRTMTVHLALYVGENKRPFSTVLPTIPKTSNLLEIMQKASEMNSDFRFRYDVINEKVLIYSISGIPNDAERHHYWKLFIQDSSSSIMNEYTEDIIYDTGGIEKIYPKGGSTIVFHYRKD